MHFPLLEKPLFQVGGHYVTFLGLIAFAALFAVGLVIARFLQSDLVRRLFSRFKIETNFIAVVTTILSLSALVFFAVNAINAAGVPLYWNAPLPGVNLSLFQIFLLIALLIAVFWISSRTNGSSSIDFSPRAGSIAHCNTRLRRSSATSSSSSAFLSFSIMPAFIWER